MEEFTLGLASDPQVLAAVISIEDDADCYETNNLIALEAGINEQVCILTLQVLKNQGLVEHRKERVATYNDEGDPDFIELDLWSVPDRARAARYFEYARVFADVDRLAEVKPLPGIRARRSPLAETGKRVTC
jgi:hypothetical protein